MDRAVSWSQASSHLQLEPVSGATLFTQETRRRDDLAGRGNHFTGCRELDEEVLLGGFERGCVVGISAEEEEVGLLIGLQTVARLFLTNLGAGRGLEPRATIITTLSAGALLPMLRDIFKAQLAAQNPHPGEGAQLLKLFLERVSISRVFDVSGLWEALGELDNLAFHEEAHQGPPCSQPSAPEVASDSLLTSADERNVQGTPNYTALSSSPLSDPPSGLPDELESETASPRKDPSGGRTEVADSEEEEEEVAADDEEDELSPPLSPFKVSPEPARNAQTVFEEKDPSDNQPSRQADPGLPDIILITHMSALLSTLFRQREKDAAHQVIQLLSSHLHYLTRSPDHGGPLIMILNSTSPSSPEATAPTNAAKPNAERSRPPQPPPPQPEAPGPESSRRRALDPTLRSVFNPAPLPVAGLGHGSDGPLSRRNKPSFGLVLTQLLDMHLLCTRVPKTRADAEALFAPAAGAAESGGGGGGGAVRYGWVVEVLLDELGVWEGSGAVRQGARRASREQRWGAVDVRRDGCGVRLVDAFEGGRKV